jgi:large subunit ribosomal protein L22
MEIKSTQKYIITSPKKIREVVPLIRKLSPAKAFEVLPFSGKRAGLKLRKVVGTALANAKQKGIKEENLFFKEIQVTDGPRLKRFRAGARGMAKPYVRKLSHIRIVLGVRESEMNSKSRKKVRSSQSAKSARDDKAGLTSLPALSKTKKGEKGGRGAGASTKK